MRVNFSVTNQLASPSIHAAALANRPAAGQPGRVFIDTDNPSTGIYRDTGTVWLQIAQNGGGGGTLQTVTDSGNTTDNNILLTYADNTVANSLVFYNEALAQEEYLIEKRGTGITTNDSLVIQSRGNISPSTNPAGIMIDGANDVIKTFYTTAYTEKGLKLDFANTQYEIGDAGSNAIRINTSSMAAYIFTNNYTNWYCSGATTEIGDTQSQGNSTKFVVDDSSQYIKTFYSGSDIGLKLDFANAIYKLGDTINDFGLIVDINNLKISLRDNTNPLEFYVDANNGLIGTNLNGNDIGLKLDFANDSYYLGGDVNSANYGFLTNSGGSYLGDVYGISNGTIIGIDDTNEQLVVSGNLSSGTAGGSSGQHLKIRVGGTDYKIALLNP